MMTRAEQLEAQLKRAKKKPVRPKVEKRGDHLPLDQSCFGDRTHSAEIGRKP